MQHVVLYADLCFRYSPAICLSYLIYDSISFSALVIFATILTFLC